MAINLGIIRKGTYSLLVRGQAFLAIINADEKKSFYRTGSISPHIVLNPMRLTIPQCILLLFSFIEGDGDVLKLFYKNLLPISESISDRDAGGYLPEIYRAIIKEHRSKARSGDDLLRIQKILDTADKIEKRKYIKKAAKDILLHSVTPRLEPFVDLGLLSKPDPFNYRYQITDATRAFFEQLISSESIDHFLNQSFFQAANKAFAINAEHRADRETILPLIQKAYTVLKSPLGYAPILEVSLLAGIYSITEMGTYFELSESLDSLKSLQKEKPDLVRFNVDRWGALSFVKFINEKSEVKGL
ncbi:MAG: hypothetical protein NC916_03450 [Candidatus Omnitrophica bacterium]|nr:hypothetical protein [Candidatus Omnitrophota bacterium]